MCNSTGFWAWLAVWITLCAGTPRALVAAEEGVETAKVRTDAEVRANVERLIFQLGADEFSKREGAANQLRAVGEELLFKPDLSRDGDLAGLDQFHNGFIVPLDESRRSDDAEIRQRAHKLFSEFSPERVIGPGPDGWALSAIYHLVHNVPKPVSNSEYFKKHGIRPPATTREQREIDKKRRLLHDEFDRLRLRKMAAENPQRTASLIMSGELDMGYRPSALGIVLTEWGHHDFAAALQFALDFDRQSGRDQSIPLHVALINIWPDDYPLAEAIRSLKRFDMGVFQYSAGMMNRIRRWAREDVDSARQWAESLKSPNHRSTAVNLIIQGLAEQDLKRAEQEISAFRDQQLRDMAKASLAATMEISGQIAKPELIDSIVDPTFRSEARAARIRSLAQSDHQSAFNALGDLEDSSDAWSCYPSIAKRWYSVDAQGCLEWIAKIEHAATHDHWIGLIVTDLARRDTNEAKRLPMNQRSEISRRRSIASIAKELSRRDANAALKLISEHSGIDQGSSEFGQGYGLGPILQNWAKNDPLSAMEWLADHPSYVQRFSIVAERLVREWARQQPLEACRWIASRRGSLETLGNFKGFAEAMMTMQSAGAKFTEN